MRGGCGRRPVGHGAGKPLAAHRPLHLGALPAAESTWGAILSGTISIYFYAYAGSAILFQVRPAVVRALRPATDGPRRAALPPPRPAALAGSTATLRCARACDAFRAATPAPPPQALAFWLSPQRYMRMAACLNVTAVLLLLWSLWAPQVRGAAGFGGAGRVLAPTAWTHGSCRWAPCTAGGAGPLSLPPRLRTVPLPAGRPGHLLVQRSHLYHVGPHLCLHLP